jgi:predicted amidohydrolase
MTYGHSVVISPDGKFVADTGEEEGMAIAETGLPVAL